ncbi:MAG: hypothetical protein ACTIKC_01915 [Psychrobacter sp.]
MITLDTTSIEAPHDEIYSVERGSKVKVFLNGDEIKGCVYCNVSKGIAICVKRDLSGQMMVAQDKIVHELVFGVVTVKSMDTDNAKRETYP